MSRVSLITGVMLLILSVATTDTRPYIDLARDLYRFHGVMMTSSQTHSIHGTDEFIDMDSYRKPSPAA